ncbi:MAG TPA: thiamine pyrophosphate-binding protein [Candidatus Limnocylindrales bacterium]|nr:thiamine pyrophosphate-binding protein [Candidatus Limnocylindrales bacterium]
MALTGGERIARMLADEGVEVVFGIIDGTYFGLYGHLADHGIRLISPRHETSALHMAGAYARMTGRLGVAIASNGPGVANALPGVAVENGEGNRVLLITSWRRHQIVGPDRGGTYQYFDQPGVIRAMSKWSGAVPSFDRIGELMHRALRISWRGRPGVVHLTVPEDIMNSPFDDPAHPDVAPARYRRTAPIEPSADLVAEAARMLVAADAPVIHAGSGVLHAHATDALLAVAELLGAPITTSWSGRDVVDERHARAVPMIYPQLVDQERTDADVVLAIGSRFSETDWWGKAPHWRRGTEQALIQVDNDEELLGLNKPVDVAVLGDAKVFLERLAHHLAAEDLASALAEQRARRATRTAGYAATRDATRAGLDAALGTPSDPLHTAHLPSAMQRVLPEDSVLVLDGGTTSVWGALYHEVRQPHSVLSTLGKFGMLGAGVPQALGAKTAAPERFVACLTGDGAFGFHPQEIETAVRAGLPVLVVVAVDRAWGMVKTTQEMTIDATTLFSKGKLPDEQHINTDFSEIRYDLMAESMGGRGLRVSASDELPAVLAEARDLVLAGHTVVVHADVDQVAHKFAPILMTFKEMHAEPAG